MTPTEKFYHDYEGNIVRPLPTPLLQMTFRMGCDAKTGDMVRFDELTGLVVLDPGAHPCAPDEKT